jgi:hypothetical protein
VHKRHGPGQDARGDTYREPVSNIHCHVSLVASFCTCSSRKKCFCICALGERRLTATRRPRMVPRYTHPEPPRPTMLDTSKWFVAASISEEETAWTLLTASSSMIRSCSRAYEYSEGTNASVQHVQPYVPLQPLLPFFHWKAALVHSAHQEDA